MRKPDGKLVFFLQDINLRMELDDLKQWSYNSKYLRGNGTICEGMVSMVSPRFFLALAVLAGLAANASGQSVWTKENSGVQAYLRTVIWSGSQCVVVGDSGIILMSADGKT